MSGFPMSAFPNQIQLSPAGHLQIEWSDGRHSDYAVRQLRDNCPCATCREKRSAPADPMQLNVLAPEETQPLTIAGMKPVGNYAYGIQFSDGHDTGIFTLEFLRELGGVES